MAVDASGDLFFADPGKHVVMEILPNGTIKIIGADFKDPTAVAVDAAGDVFVADRGNSAVKEILPNGTIKTIGTTSKIRPAWRWTRPATSLSPTPAHHAVKEVLPNGAIKTIGSHLKKPRGVAVDAAGEVFVIDTGKSAGTETGILLRRASETRAQRQSRFVRSNGK